MSPAPMAERRDALIAGYAALAVVIHVLEAAVPSPVPGVKPGLANMVVLVALLRHGWSVAAWVALLRVVAGALLAGTFLAPAFWLSGGGALASLAALAAGMAWNRAMPGAPLSALGLAVLASLAHVTGQLAVAGVLFVPDGVLWRLLPGLAAAALVFGMLSGWAAGRLIERLEAAPA
ncbi:MAG TPA: Gx transporter family protein [Candidatus Binatia bacterium]|nr:Gx transporter family protein [Candidatus Binatia bacterium]